MKIGDRVYVHGFVDEIRKDTVIIRNAGGYFGTVKSEIVEAQKAEDIVSVIRCKDCDWFDRKESWCEFHGFEVPQEKKGFCYWAVRKEEDG